jgi:chemotaxis protein CheC
MSSPYSDLQLDALRELANIGSGTAATALSSMLGRPVDVSVPSARALPLAEAVEATGDPEAEANAVVIPVIGDLTGVVLLLFTPEDAAGICRLLGVEPDSEWAESALGEIGNIVGTSYMNAMGAMTGLEMEPDPPLAARDMLGALVASVVMDQLDGTSDTTLLLDSELLVEGESCSMSFLLVPAAGGVQVLLERLGLGDA